MQKPLRPSTSHGSASREPPAPPRPPLPPAETLLAAADECDARYIVVGSYGERPLKSALVGSTPSRLMHLSSHPVLVVRAED